MQVMARTNLKSVRESLSPKVSQEEVARLTNVTLATYRNAESGKNVSYSTATAILQGFNSLLASRGMDALTLDDLGLHIV